METPEFVDIIYCDCEKCQAGTPVLLFFKDQKGREYCTLEGAQHFEESITWHDEQAEEEFHRGKRSPDPGKRPSKRGDWRYYKGRAIAKNKAARRAGKADG